MFDFVKKAQLWKALDANWHKDVMGNAPFHLKTIQDLAVYPYLKDMTSRRIGEIGGGNSRILPRLARANECYNIEKFEGTDAGPKKEIVIPGVKNLKAFVGEFSDTLKPVSFDVLFSISVVEHVPDDRLADFFEDSVRILKPGGTLLHAIDIYVSDTPSDYWRNRFELYRKAVMETESLSPLGDVSSAQLRFTCDMASNPDNIMHSWRRISSSLDDLRQTAQSVSLLWGARKDPN